MLDGMIGRKLGMMRLYDGSGRVHGVTVIELGPNRVTQLRTKEHDGYEAVQLGFTGNRKRLNRPERGHLRRANVDAPLSMLQGVQDRGHLGLRHRAGDHGRGVRGRTVRQRDGHLERARLARAASSAGTSAAARRRTASPTGIARPVRWARARRRAAPGKGQKMAGHMGAEQKTVTQSARGPRGPRARPALR